jgi:hypothetical protein
MKTIILAIVASVMLAATAHAQEPITCEGILKQEDSLLFMAVKDAEDPHKHCIFDNPTAKWKVLAACRPGRLCRVRGMAEECGGTAWCNDVTRVLSAYILTTTHPTIRLRAWQR